MPPPSQESSEHGLELLPYTPADHTGKILGGYSVFYQYVEYCNILQFGVKPFPMRNIMQRYQQGKYKTNTTTC